MASDRWLTRAGRLVLGACLIAVAQTGVARSADTSARIVLLPAGERASVVVEFDDEVPKATAIEAADSRSFDVEIGPVRSKVANQWLQAAKQSPLVSEVRVRVVPQGAQGTLVTLHVTAKTPVSGLVRRAQRRIYIDLEPLSVAAASKPVGRTAPAAPDAAAPSAATRPPGPVNPAPEVSGAATSTPMVASPSPVAGTTSDVSPARSPATAMPTAPSSPSVPASAVEDIQRRAELLARQSDVKGLEKLKRDVIARRTSSASGSGSVAGSDAPDPTIEQIDQYLDEARQKRLLTDARLFKDSQPSTTPAAVVPEPDPDASAHAISPDEAFRRAIELLIPELEKMNAMLSQWQPGFVPSPSLPQSLEALTIRLRVLRPPVRLSAFHERLCVALGALAKSWVPGADGVSLVPVGPDTEARLIMTAKGALYDYLKDLALNGPTGPMPSTTPPA